MVTSHNRDHQVIFYLNVNPSGFYFMERGLEEKMKQLPYATSKADPAKAQQRIRDTLIRFGVSRIIFDEDFENNVLSVKFTFKNLPVVLPINHKRLAEAYIKADPWTRRKSQSKDAWHEKKRDIACRASFSLLEDFIKSMVLMVEIDMFSFEEIFMSHFINEKGERLGDMIAHRLPEFVSGGLALTDGKG